MVASCSEHNDVVSAEIAYGVGVVVVVIVTEPVMVKVSEQLDASTVYSPALVTPVKEIAFPSPVIGSPSLSPSFLS